MLPAALALLAAIAVGARAAYPRFVERRASQRRPLGPDGVIVGADAISLPRANAPGALLLHGGGDTPQVLAGLARYLYERGFSVRVPLLTGHGRALSAFAEVASSTWHSDAEREFADMRARHEQVAVVGLSMGAALAIKLAADSRDVTALVLLSPYVAMSRVIRAAAATSSVWGRLYPYFSSQGKRSILDPAAAARGLGYGIFTPSALRSLHEVVIAAERALPAVRAPALMIQSREDNRISPSDAARAFAMLGSAEKELIWTEGAGHVITVDFGHERVFELTADWLLKHARPARPAGA